MAAGALDPVSQSFEKGWRLQEAEEGGDWMPPGVSYASGTPNQSSRA